MTEKDNHFIQNVSPKILLKLGDVHMMDSSLSTQL